MEQYKQEFIEFMVDSDVLKFGEFTLKSGRKSPFFMNAGAYVTGSQLKKLGEYYAKAIHDKYGDDFDVLFIGGSTAWKLGPHARQLVGEAKARGKRVHMGRVNSGRRYRYAHAIGCDTVDGTYLTFGPDKNLPAVLAWMRGATSQGGLS